MKTTQSVNLVVLLVATAFPFSIADHDEHSDHELLVNKYSFSSVLHNKDGGMYTLHWTFDIDQETISFAVNVSTAGWVGFGLSPNGGMTNSDVVIGWVKDGTVHFHVSVVVVVELVNGDGGGSSSSSSSSI